MASDSATLALWGYQLLGGAIISGQSLAAMTTFIGTDAGPYGMGVFDQTTLANGFGVTTVGNGGWDEGGYSAVLSVIPSEAIAVVVLANVAGDPKARVMPVAQQMVGVLR
jgi:CubicO group peptidase (beta-lactamase class C family)